MDGIMVDHKDTCCYCARVSIVMKAIGRPYLNMENGDNMEKV